MGLANARQASSFPPIRRTVERQTSMDARLRGHGGLPVSCGQGGTLASPEREGDAKGTRPMHDGWFPRKKEPAMSWLEIVALSLLPLFLLLDLLHRAYPSTPSPGWRVRAFVVTAANFMLSM